MAFEQPSPQPIADFAAARRAMIDSQLRPQGVTDHAVLAAMARVPREDFVPEELRALAYSDRALGGKGGAALMPPASLARLLTEVMPRRGERALVIGAGNGYAPAVLAEIGLAVDTASPDALPAKGQYDIVLIDGAVEEVPSGLAARLAPGGRLAAAIVDNGISRLAIGRCAGGVLGVKTFADSEVPVLPGFSRPPAFTF